MSNETAFIQQLLTAERRAKEFVNEARKRRVSRIQQAHDESKAECDAIAKEFVEKFAQFEIDAKTSCEKIAKEIETKTIAFISTMLTDAQKHNEPVIQELIELVFNIEPEIHKNYKFKKHMDHYDADEDESV